MQVKAKFTCSHISENGYGGKTVNFHAVYSSDGENASFSKATPSGQLSMNIDPGTPAVDFFQHGQNYYLTFEEAPK